MLGQHTVTAARPTVAQRRSRQAAPQIRRPLAAAGTHVQEQLGNAIIPRVMVAMVLCMLAMLLYLQQASQVSVHEFSMAALQQQRTQYSLTNVDLHARASRLSSVARIEQIATTQLHMGDPDPTSELWVYPVVPRVSNPPSALSGTVQAKQVSSPLHWMTSAVTWARAQL